MGMCAGPLAQMAEQGTLKPFGVGCDEMPQDFDLTQWITTQEAARLTGYSSELFRVLARKGAIAAYKMGRDWLLSREAVLEHYKEMQALGTDKHNPHRQAGKD